MYELIEVVEDNATRFIKLKNMDTGVIEECFDDSAVVSDKNFDFMKIGQLYECKIKLFGKSVAGKTSESVQCKVINKEIVIGKKIMVEVQVNDNKYYIPRQKISECLEHNCFNFHYTRKDLIQVNNTIHADLL